MSQSINESCLEILRATNDGDNLAPHHLIKLLESAANGFLTERGELVFYELLQNVRSGYTKPWFHNIEHLSIDLEGYVYWKEHQVEHYDLPWAYSDDAKRHATELAVRCQHLENIGIEVTCSTAIWRWEQYADQQSTIF